MKRKMAVFAILLAAALLLTSCKLFKNFFGGPCDDVYFGGGELMVPTPCSSYSQTSLGTDANGCYKGYTFSAIGCGTYETDYRGTVTFTRDASCNIVSRTLEVNGETYD